MLTRKFIVGAIGYLAFLVSVISGAMWVVSRIATARVPIAEIAIVVWFTISLRLAWEVWSRAVGRLGEVRRRWGRRRRKHGTASTSAYFCRLIPIARAALTLIIFVPVAFSFVLTHRFKLADGTDPKSTLSMEFENIRIPTLDGCGEIAAWFVPSPGAVRTILICHGAGANKGNFIWFLPPLAHRGYNLVLFDFRAHGGSSGRICTYGLDEKDDVLAVVAWLKSERPEKTRQIVGLGSSLGSMALVRAAAQTTAIDAVVLDSPYLAPRQLAHDHLSIVPFAGPAFADLVLWWMGVWTGADFLQDGATPFVARIAPRPIMIIHGDDDVIMPASHAQQLFDLAAEPRELWMGPGPHSNIITTEPEEYADRLMLFLRKSLPAGD